MVKPQATHNKPRSKFRSQPISANRTSSSHRTAYVALIILTIVLGLVVRRVPLGLPPVVVKFGGSMLWAAMVYWIFAEIRAAASAEDIAINAALFSVAVEFFKLYHASALDAFRRTVAGTLLLGRYFSWWDIAAYLAAIALVSFADQRLIRRA
jgi:hypothetical protein